MARPPLYKYLDVQGAKLTLGNRTFKHAKPTDFNDTEDLTIQSIFPEDVETALTKLASSFTDVIAKNLDTPPTCGPSLGDKVVLLQRMFLENPEAAKFVKEEIKKDPAGLHDVAHMREAFIQEMNAFMQDYRVLCVTTHRCSERMWTEYAQNHAGIALRIEPSTEKEKDSKFQLFRPVQYAISRPPLYASTLDFQVSSLFGDQEKTKRTMLDKIVYTKIKEWEHESEYRLSIPLRQGENWNTLPYHPEEITELYLGLAMTDENRKEIIAKANAINPMIRIFQTSRNANQTLTFEQL